MVREIYSLISDSYHNNVDFKVQSDIWAVADKGLIRIVLENLIENACKYSARKEKANIEFGASNAHDKNIYFVKDNGAGFNMHYAFKLFTPFQRLHTQKEFEGTGIGLAVVKRIIQRHGGRVWAESSVGEGATFYFTLD